MLLLRDRNHFFHDALYSPSYFFLIWWYISRVMMYPTSFRVCCLEIHEKIMCRKHCYGAQYLQKYHMKSPVPEPFLIKLQASDLKPVFSCEICEIFLTFFFIEHIWWLVEFSRISASDNALIDYMVRISQKRFQKVRISKLHIKIWSVKEVQRKKIYLNTSKTRVNTSKNIKQLAPHKTSQHQGTFGV